MPEKVSFSNAISVLNSKCSFNSYLPQPHRIFHVAAGLYVLELSPDSSQGVC